MKKSYNNIAKLEKKDLIKISQAETEIEKKRLLSMISMSKAANHLSYGFDAVKKTVNDKNCRLLILAKDLSENSKEEITFLSKQNEVSYIIVPFTMDILEMELGKRVGILSVTDAGLSNAIMKIYNNLENRRSAV